MKNNEEFKETIETKIFSIPLWTMKDQEHTNKFISHIQYRMIEIKQTYEDLLYFLNIEYPAVFKRICDSTNDISKKDYEMLNKKTDQIREIYINAKDLYKI